MTHQWMSRYSKTGWLRCGHVRLGRRCRRKIRVGQTAGRPSRNHYHTNPYWPKCERCSRELGLLD